MSTDGSREPSSAALLTSQWPKSHTDAAANCAPVGGRKHRMNEARRRCSSALRTRLGSPRRTPASHAGRYALQGDRTCRAMAPCAAADFEVRAV